MLQFKTMKIVLIAVGAVMLVGIAVPAAMAHHSAAAQDFSKRVPIDGIVQSWELVNPHGRVVLRVTDAKGTRDIEYETHSRNNVYRAGYRDGMVKPGDKIRVNIAPNRNGSDGGYIASFVTAAGVKVGNN
jgi:hypothetical protein